MSKKGDKDHFVNQGYLRNFCDENLTTNKFHCWKAADGWNRKERGSSEVGYRYSFYNKQVDQELIKLLETKFGEVFKTKIQNLKQLTGEEREWLALYTALMLLRTPTSRDRMDDFADKITKKAVNLYIKNVPPEIVEKESGMKQPEGWNINNEKLKLTNEGFAQFMISPLSDFANILLRMNWTILRGDGNARFITSDNPVVLEYHHFDHFHSLLVGAFFPLSPFFCLAITRPTEFDPPNNELSYENALPLLPIINMQLVRFAREFLISSKETFVRIEWLESKRKPKSDNQE
ncbi:MAG: DUF4238 domain-containing protein [Deltaproteobacteria bacterium]|nr:DUF4238 domain-containing protein [Candidatus Zymogenaceae bacterium]